jgi:acetyl esterase/lipase
LSISNTPGTISTVVPRTAAMVTLGGRSGTTIDVISWLFLLVSLVGAAFTYNALRPHFTSPRRAVLSFFAGWLTGELALHHVAVQAVLTVGFISMGALARWPGVAGLAITIASWIGLVATWLHGRSARQIVADALTQGLGDGYGDNILPELSARLAAEIAWRRPTLLQVHGGAWILGNKDQQGLPLMLHLAARGWVCVSVNYRLSPRATFPDHLVDLKRALKWIREHIAEYGGDPDFVVATGGSAGGHLASLVALTANDPEYQPGFEDVDTSVRGCVPFYGVYDFTDRFGLHRHDGLRRLLERRVMKRKLRDDPRAYEKASPMCRIHPGAPPFFVIHGDRDTLAPVEEARRFVEELRRGAHDKIAYAELPGAQHAFEIFPSLRAALVIQGVERFLAHLYSEYLVTKRKRTDAEPTRAAG